MLEKILNGCPDANAAQTAPVPSRRAILVHQNFVSPGQSGNSRGWSIVVGLAENGWDVHIIAPRIGYLGGEIGAENCTAGPKPTVHRLNLRNSGTGPAARIRTTIEFTGRAMAHGLRLPPPTVVYAATAPSPPVLGAIILSVLRGAPMLLEVSDLWPLWLVDAGSLKSRPAIWALEFIEALSYRYAHRIVAIGPTFPPYLAQFGVEPGRLTAVVSGVESWMSGDEVPDTRCWRDKHGLAGKRLVIYAGSFNEAYGLGLLLHAACKLKTSHPHVVWLFAGNGRSLSMIVHAQAAGLPVRYLGNLRRLELATVFAAADVGIVSLLDKGYLNTALSGKVFDYMAAGLPVLVTTDGITAEFVRQAACGLVAQNPDAKSVAGAMGGLLDLPMDALAQLGNAGRQWAREHVDANYFVAQVNRDFDTLASGRRPGVLRNILRLSLAILQASRDVASRRSVRAATTAYNRPWGAYVDELLPLWRNGIRERKRALDQEREIDGSERAGRAVSKGPDVPAARPALKMVCIGNIPLSSGEPELVADWMLMSARALQGTTVVAHINTRNYYFLHYDPGLQEKLLQRTILLSDGIGMKLATLIHGHGNLPDLNGTDLFPLVMSRGEAHGLRIFLLGGYPDVARRARLNIEARFPGVVVVGHRDGYFSSLDEPDLLDEIRKCAPDMLLVGFGFPTQEKFSIRVQDELKVPLVWNIGGLFDFVSGAKPRAPRYIRKCKMEWLYRFLLEPRVMWHRNVVAMPWFIVHILRLRMQNRNANNDARPV